jgi:probable rRNA maturation factor
MGEDGTAGRARLIAEVTAPAAARGAARDLSRWLARAAPRQARGEVAIALVNDSTMRRLNRRHRGIDRVTDVLSFPHGGDDLGFGTRGRIQPRVQTRGLVFLGDIAIATGVARRQAREHGHSIAVEIRILALHGLLHLLGYDHDVDRGEMRRLEERLRAQAGLPAGVIARATSRAVPR